MFVPSSEVVHRTRFPLIALERHRVDLDPALLARARTELVGSGARETGFRYGFLLGVQADEAAHPACLALSRTLHSQLLAPLETTPPTSNALVPGMRGQLCRFSLSFIKLAEGEPPSAGEGPLFEGPHLDTHPVLTDSTELLRLLVNLSEHPRRFLYAATDRWGLAELGVPYGRRKFVPLHLPPEIESRVVTIPGRTDTTVHALKFLASAVPHVGLNDPPEHFLLSFEALTE